MKIALLGKKVSAIMFISSDSHYILWGISRGCQRRLLLAKWWLQKSKDVKVKEISTKVANLVLARPNETTDACMAKMLSRDIRHLPLVDEYGEVVGIISIKDLIKICLEDKEHTINCLASFAVGEGGHFVM